MKKTNTPVATLLQTAEVQVPVAPPAPVIIAEPVSPYVELLAGLPGDPDTKAWLLNQVEVSRSWGINEMLRIEAGLLIALLDKASGK
jgi:hypothetical protein